MKWILPLWITLAAVASAAPDSLSTLRRQVEEQERQIRQLEVENSRLRYMLTEVDHHSGDPLYGTKISGRPGDAMETAVDLEEVHLVREGDTLSQIAAERGVKLEALASLNEISDPSTILPGQRLRLPEETKIDPPAIAAKPTPVSPARHTVGKGENLYRISLRYGVALDELLAANPAIDPRKLRVGQQVRLPRPAPMLAGGS